MSLTTCLDTPLTTWASSLYLQKQKFRTASIVQDLHAQELDSTDF